LWVDVPVDPTGKRSLFAKVARLFLTVKIFTVFELAHGRTYSNQSMDLTHQ
jgi:hypothetical protein